jgi:molecular chaperone Hsp33
VIVSTDISIHYHLLDYRMRAVVAVVTGVTQEAQRRHGLDPLTTIAFGRAVGCASLLASTLKRGPDYLHCSFKGNGILSRVVAECNGEGHCRGYTSPARLVDTLPERKAMPQKVGDALGEGTLSVTRGSPTDRQPYTAVASLLNGEIASDVAKYLAESEQIPSAVAAGVKLSPAGEVLGAGAVLVQKLAGAVLDDAVLVAVEERLRSPALALSERIARGEEPDQIAAYIIENLQGVPQAKEPWGRLTTKALEFRCTCSRDKMSNVLFALGEDQLKKIEQETGRLEVRCPYCATSHRFQMSELVKQ